MMKTTHILQYTGKNNDEKLPEKLGFAVEEANTGLMGLIHTLLSDIHGIKYYLEAWGKYLFPVAFGLKLADWISTAWQFLQSSNKNLAKTNNLFLKTITTGLIGLAIFGGVVIGTAMVPVIFSIAIGLDILVSAGKAIWFGVAASRSKNSDEKSFFSAQAKENAIKAGIGIIALAGVVIGMIAAPYVATAIIAVVSVAVAATLIGVGILGLVKRYQAHKALKSIQATSTNTLMEQSRREHTARNEVVEQSHVENQPIVPTGRIEQPFRLATAKYTGFFDNTLKIVNPVATTDITNEIKQLKKAVKTQIEKLGNDIESANEIVEKHLWSQANKRENKIAALHLLKEIIDQFDLIVQNSPITIAGKSFAYENVNDLILKVDSRITHHFPKAYQSFFKDIGGVEALTKQAYKLLIAKAQSGSRNVANDEHVVTNFHNNVAS